MISLNEKIYVLDFETVNSNHVCQIGISLVDTTKQEISLVYREFIKPPCGVAGFNPIAMNKHSLSVLSILNARSFGDQFTDILSIIGGEQVLHWGGNDHYLFKKQCEMEGWVNDDVKFMNIWNLVCPRKGLREVSSNLGLPNRALHDAGFDSFLAALLFHHLYLGNEISDVQLGTLNELDTSLARSQGAFRVTDAKKPIHTRKKVCYSGFSRGDKEMLSSQYAEYGFEVMASVGRSTDYLVVPCIPFERAYKKMKDAERYGVRVLTIEQFEELVMKKVA